MDQAVILSAVRTPIGKFQGGLAPLSAPQLGAKVVAEAVRRAGTDPMVQTFGIAAAACGLLAVILFMVYKLILGSGVSSLGDLAGRL